MGDNLDMFKKYTLEEAITNRRTIREITGKRISSHYLDKLLWAAYGKTLVYEGDKYRTAPSAGATYPIELYVFVERVDDFEDGLYIYNTDSEKLEIYRPGVHLPEVRKLSWDQEFVSLSNAVFVMVYNPRKIEKEYGNKSRDYALLECGHIAQNIHLMTAALGLGGVPVGAFSQRRITSLLNLKGDKKPLYMVCVGTVN